MVKNGDRVKDRITGLEGVVVGITDYLYGCKVALVNPQVLKDGKPVESVWLDEDRLEVIQAGVFAKGAVAAERAGGPRDDHAPSDGK